MSDPSKMPWGPDTSWGSYMPPLMAALAQTSGPVLEVGVGHWSTPTLHAFCRASGRYLMSLESNPDWGTEFFAEYQSDQHRFVLNRYDMCPSVNDGPDGKGWSIVFIDNSPGGRRAADALLFKDSAEFIIVHDWSSSEIAGPFEPILQQWRYRHLYNRYPPSTMVLSNTRELIL